MTTNETVPSQLATEQFAWVQRKNRLKNLLEQPWSVVKIALPRQRLLYNRV